MSRKNIANKKNFLGKRLRSFRLSQNLTQQRLAAILKTSSSQISEIESGKKMPGSRFLESLLRELNININWLLTGEGTPFAESTHIYNEEDEETGSALIYNEGNERGKWEKTGLGDAVEQLQKIYASGDKALIRAINANLEAFSRAVDTAAQVETLTARMTKMEDTIKKLEKIIDDLGRRDDCCIRTAAPDEEDVGPSTPGC